MTKYSSSILFLKTFLSVPKNVTYVTNFELFLNTRYSVTTSSTSFAQEVIKDSKIKKIDKHTFGNALFSSYRHFNVEIWNCCISNFFVKIKRKDVCVFFSI